MTAMFGNSTGIGIAESMNKQKALVFIFAVGSVLV